MPSASARAAKLLLLFASRPELPRACQLWWGAAIIPSNPFNHRRSTLSRPNPACTVCLSICKSRLFLLLSLTPHSQDTHSPSAIPHCVASPLACTRYAALVPPTARVAWLCFRWGGQLHSDSTVVADTDNTSNHTRHNSHLNRIPSQCLDSRRLPISRPGRPSPSTTTSECSFNRANLRIELELTSSAGSVAPLC